MNNTFTPPMKHIFDASFRYSPSFDTDIRATFARIRREQAALHAAQQARLVVLELVRDKVA
jgi:hypothetical protein